MSQFKLFRHINSEEFMNIVTNIDPDNVADVIETLELVKTNTFLDVVTNKSDWIVIADMLRKEEHTTYHVTATTIETVMDKMDEWYSKLYSLNPNLCRLLAMNHNRLSTDKEREMHNSLIEYAIKNNDKFEEITITLPKPITGRYEIPITLPDCFDRIKRDIERVISNDEKRNHLLSIMNRIEQDPELFYLNRTSRKRNATKLSKVLIKAFEKYKPIKKFSWWEEFNLCRVSNISELKAVITNDPITKLGMSIFTSGWSSCMKYHELLRNDLDRLAQDPDTLIIYITDGTMIEKFGIEHEMMIARAILRIVRLETNENRIGIFINTVYPDERLYRRHIEAVIRKICEENGFEIAEPTLVKWIGSEADWETAEVLDDGLIIEDRHIVVEPISFE